MKERVTFIYALRDPRDRAVHYIGKSNSPKARFTHHLEDKKTNPQRAAWIAELAALGLQPSLDILAMMEQSWFAIKKRGGNPKIEYSDHKQFWYGSRVVRAMQFEQGGALCRLNASAGMSLSLS